MTIFVAWLPLPPSKNVSKQGIPYFNKAKGRMSRTKLKVNTDATNSYRIYVNRTIKELMEKRGIKFDPGRKVIVNCTWIKRTPLEDAHNYHQELMDALKTPLGVDDRFFLIRDIDYTVDKNDPGVQVEIIQEG